MRQLGYHAGGWRHPDVPAGASMDINVKELRRCGEDMTSKVAEVVNSQFIPDGIMPADIANLALFLAADDSRMITRQTFNVNGGRA